MDEPPCFAGDGHSTSRGGLSDIKLRDRGDPSACHLNTRSAPPHTSKDPSSQMYIGGCPSYDVSQCAQCLNESRISLGDLPPHVLSAMPPPPPLPLSLSHFLYGCVKQQSTTWKFSCLLRGSLFHMFSVCITA